MKKVCSLQIHLNSLWFSQILTNSLVFNIYCTNFQNPYMNYSLINLFLKPFFHREQQEINKLQTSSIFLTWFH